LPWDRKKRVYFLPNRYQKTKEQQEGLEQLNETGRDKEGGTILPVLSHRPALYGSVLNGSKENFFTKKESELAKKIFEELFRNYAKNKN
jgi:hypothetical protein